LDEGSPSVHACPDDDALAIFAEGLAGADERSRVEDHVRGCAPCGEVLDAMNATYAGGAGEASADPTTTIGRYELVAPIGEGGMGIVYEARDPMLGRRVAVKLLRAGVGEEAEEARLLREARAMARVAHPNVVTVYDAGIQDGRVFLAMELVRGPSLRAHLDANPELSFDARLALLRAAARALVAAHAANVVHRDFKPENVLVDGGGARVMDFGLARPGGTGLDDAIPTSGDVQWMLGGATRGVHGTPSYMSPEQLDGRATIDAKTDQWSFAVTLYEALYGMHPFGLGRPGAPETLSDLRRAMDRGPAAPPSLPSASPWIWPLLERALRVSPDERFPSMARLAAELDGPAPEPLQGTRLLSMLSTGLGAMCGVHIALLALFVLAVATPDEPQAHPDTLGETIAGVTLVLWGLLGAVLAPLSALGVSRRRRWSFYTSVAYTIVSFPTLLGTPFAIFATYALSRPAVRGALTGRTRRP
jgi:serine/threonine protein kinase